VISLPLPFQRHDAVRIKVVGAGGTGSAIITGLARMHVALRELGGHGFSVTLCDPDTVSESNIGRQLFSAADVGSFKSDVLIQRVNLYHGLDWTSAPCRVEAMRDRDPNRYCELVIGCVDTVKARLAIRDNGHARWWLDCGNDARTAQFVLGNPKTIDVRRQMEGDDAPAERAPAHIPNVLDLFPALTAKGYKESNAPSCSMAEALRKQDLFINQTVATFALDLLWDWFRRGSITTHGAFINLETKQVRPLPIDPATWERMNPKLKPSTGEPKAARKKTRQADTK
jgi:PRTRC genetic system ThiF family protein